MPITSAMRLSASASVMKATLSSVASASAAPHRDAMTFATPRDGNTIPRMTPTPQADGELTEDLSLIGPGPQLRVQYGVDFSDHVGVIQSGADGKSVKISVG